MVKVMHIKFLVTYFAGCELGSFDFYFYFMSLISSLLMMLIINYSVHTPASIFYFLQRELFLACITSSAVYGRLIKLAILKKSNWKQRKEKMLSAYLL